MFGAFTWLEVNALISLVPFTAVTVMAGRQEGQTALQKFNANYNLQTFSSKINQGRKLTKIG